MRIDTVNIHLGGMSPLIASAMLSAFAASSIPGTQPTKRASGSATSNLTPPKIGEYWTTQGGVYVGTARGFDERGDAHLILAVDPASKFEGRSLGTYGIDVKGATSDYDGLANTIALAKAGSELCKEILEVEIDGHKDFALMSRQDARLCIANVPEQFEKEWHLTSTQASVYNAWGQDFNYGGQNYSRKKFEGRARLVRRLFL